MTVQETHTQEKGIVLSQMFKGNQNIYIQYNTEFCYVFKQCISKYREVPLIMLGCRSPDLWKVGIYNCSFFDKWSVGWLVGVFFCLRAFLFFLKKSYLEKKDPVCIMVQWLEYSLMELNNWILSPSLTDEVQMYRPTSAETVPNHLIIIQSG